MRNSLKNVYDMEQRRVPAAYITMDEEKNILQYTMVSREYSRSHKETSDIFMHESEGNKYGVDIGGVLTVKFYEQGEEIYFKSNEMSEDFIRNGKKYMKRDKARSLPEWHYYDMGYEPCSEYGVMLMYTVRDFDVVQEYNDGTPDEIIQKVGVILDQEMIDKLPPCFSDIIEEYKQGDIMYMYYDEEKWGEKKTWAKEYYDRLAQYPTVEDKVHMDDAWLEETDDYGVKYFGDVKGAYIKEQHDKRRKGYSLIKGESGNEEGKGKEGIRKE